MKKAIFSRMTAVLVLAILVSSLISCYYAGRQMLMNTEQDMKAALYLLDAALEEDGELQAQVDRLKEQAWDGQARITVLALDGTVLADTDSSLLPMENHIEREEVQAALRNGAGFASRYSGTLERHMLYAAALAGGGDYLIRIAVPYTGVFDYIKAVLPFIFIGLLLVFAVSVLLFSKLTGRITGPLGEITGRLERMRRDDYRVKFPRYPYGELNVIADTVTQMAGEIREHLEQVEREKKVRQEFFSNVSHELKTPITSVRGYAELLDGGFVKDRETEKDFISRILKESENMTTLIDDILMISRLESGEAQVTFSMVKLDRLLEETVRSLEPAAAAGEIQVETDCEPVVLEANVKQMRELFSNLLTNAVKYNRPGGRVWASLRREGEEVCIRVRDTGCGIPPEDIGHIFERFYRVDKGRSRRQGGTGLGLSIVKHVVEYYGGNVAVRSEPGAGSEFVVRIPVKSPVYQ